MDISKLKRQLERVTKQAQVISNKHCGKENSVYNYYGGWDLGYLYGKISVLENIIDCLDVDKSIDFLNTNIRDRIQVKLTQYICIGYKIYTFNDTRIRKTKAYRKYANIRETILVNRYKNIILNSIGQELHNFISNKKWL